MHSPQLDVVLFHVLVALDAFGSVQDVVLAPFLPELILPLGGVPAKPGREV